MPDDFEQLLTGIVSVIPSQAIRLLGSPYATLADAAKEFITNAYGSGAQRIVVEIEEDRITVTDDGSGMLHKPPEDDLQILNRFLAGVRRGDANLVDPRPLMSEVGRKSLFCVCTVRTLSPQLAGEGTREQPGLHGVGMDAWRYFAERAYVLSRPDPNLIKRAFGVTSPGANNPPTYRATLPSMTMLGQFNTQLVIEKVATLRDHENKEVEHGTKVVMEGLAPGVVKQLAVGGKWGLAAYYRKRFAGYLLAGVKILIIDKTVSPAVRYPLTPPKEDENVLLQGPWIIDEKEGLMFDGIVFYPALPEHPDLMLERAREAVCKIVDLDPRLNLDVFRLVSGRLSYVQFAHPGAPDEEQSAPVMWDLQKSRPKPTREYEQYISALIALASSIEAAIVEIEKERRDERMSQLSEVATEAVTQAIFESGIFGKIGFEKPEPRVKGKGARTRRKIQPRILASVYNQHWQQLKVGGIPVKLICLSQVRDGRNVAVNREVATVLTTPGGTANFGDPKRYDTHPETAKRTGYGRYRLEIDVKNLPPGVSLITSYKTEPFNISSNHPDADFDFQLNVEGAEKIVAEKLPEFHIWFPLLRPELPYDTSKLLHGEFGINANGSFFKEAWDSNNTEVVNLLMSLYVRDGLLEYIRRKSDLVSQFTAAELTEESTKLYLSFYSYLKAGQAERSRRAKKEKTGKTPSRRRAAT